MTTVCQCRSPVQSTAGFAGRRRCVTCNQPVAHGRLLSAGRVRRLAGTVDSYTAQIVADWPWVADLAHNPTRRGGGSGAGLTVVAWSDPTLDAVASPQRALIRSLAVLACRDAERAVRALADADEALGAALLVADGRRRYDPAPVYANTTVVPSGRPDLQEAHDARDRRHIRGEIC